MSSSFKKYFLIYSFLFIFFVTIFVFYFILKEKKEVFVFAALDVGQGDAFFINSPSGKQVLVDAGPPRKILGQLQQVMSPFDKKIDILIITNPDEDHIAGFLEILNTYETSLILEPGTFNSSKTYQNFQKIIKEKNIPSILARQGMVLDLGEGVFLEVIFPDRDVFLWENNDGSLVMKLWYKNFSVLLMGDATYKTEEIILSQGLDEKLKSFILKIGHHGSKTSTSLNLLEKVSPEYALISVGKNNKYKHPHQSVLDLLEDLKIKILRTDEDGIIIIKCDKMDICKIKKSKN